MKPFAFRLDKVLNYRKFQEKQALGSLMKLKNEVSMIEKSILRLKTEKSDIIQKCHQEGFKGIDVPTYKLYISFMQKLDQDIETGYNDLEDAAIKVKAQEAVVRTKSIKRKALEILKENRLTRHMEIAQHQEQKELDELVMSKWGELG